MAFLVKKKPEKHLENNQKQYKCFVYFLDKPRLKGNPVTATINVIFCN